MPKRLRFGLRAPLMFEILNLWAGFQKVIKLFEDRRIRYAWDAEKEEWLFSVVDVVGALTDQPDIAHARNYWKVLKKRLMDEGNETVTNCNQLKMQADDGKQRLTCKVPCILLYVPGVSLARCLAIMS